MEASAREFLKTTVSLGLVIKADLETVQAIKKLLADHNVNVIYQTVSAGKLWITKGEAEVG
jgi:hypothetical protein